MKSIIFELEEEFQSITNHRFFPRDFINLFGFSTVTVGEIYSKTNFNIFGDVIELLQLLCFSKHYSYDSCFLFGLCTKTFGQNIWNTARYLYQQLDEV